MSGLGFINAEAGPSRARSSTSLSSNSLGLDGHDDHDQYEEELAATSDRLQEMDLSTHEDNLLNLRTPRRSTTLKMSRTPDPSMLSFTHSSHFPSPVKPPLPRAARSHIRAAPTLAALDLPNLVSASEVFGSITPPRMIRRTTYSSLPPSPHLNLHGDDDDHPDPISVNGHRSRPGGKGLGIIELEDVLGRIGAGEVEIEETWWPARSRRGTFDGDTRDLDRIRDELRSVSPDPLSDREARSPSPEPGIDLGDKEGTGSSLWDLLVDETGAEGWEGSAVDGKWERIQNFLAVPLAMERVTLFGALLCLDGFLYNFTILPFRSLFALLRLARLSASRQTIFPIPPTHLHSLLRMLLIFIPTTILLVATDASKMYHTVRGQDTIKLYVIFNALEIADRLCCAFGQDVLDTLFARDTLTLSTTKIGRGRRRHQARPFFFFALSLGYVLAHTLIYFYMLVSLNVAINSYDYTLLSLLISNQFVEIKGSVFKKFDKENLFQILCADIVERFQLSLMLTVISLRNILEMSGSEIAFLPKSFMKGKGLLDSILSPVLFVVISEMGVDWLKHAFITKFNHIRASVYGRYADVLAKDVLAAGNFGDTSRRGKTRNHPLLLDQSPLVARRLGFASIPLACLVIRIGVQAIGMLTASSHHHDERAGAGIADLAWKTIKVFAGVGVGVSAWGCLVALKVLLGLLLLSYSALRQAGMEEREAEDSVNDIGRTAVGETKEEREYNQRTKDFLSKADDDLPEYPSISRSSLFNPEDIKPDVKPDIGMPKTSGKGEGRKKWRLEDVERWTMVKRIW